MRLLKLIIPLLFLIFSCSDEREWFSDWTPENFRIIDDTPESVTMQWEAPAKDIDCFIIDKKIDGLDWEINFSGEIKKSVLQYQDNSVEPMQRIYYRLYAKKGNEYSKYTTVQVDILQYPGL
jgi:hypothetical protein